ncbi:MAG: hypothetical protein HY965_04030 [Ignavibacteriales bacterium]|nr:hypothetical protein [Ignavibacteriales bacterium]
MQQTNEKVFDVAFFFEPWMVAIAIITISVIFYLIYRYRDNFFGEVQFADSQDEESKKLQAQKAEEDKVIPVVIGLAINQYLEEMNEYEKTILTIKKVIKPYTPWSSKIYGLRQAPLFQPRRK